MRKHETASREKIIKETYQTDPDAAFYRQGFFF